MLSDSSMLTNVFDCMCFVSFIGNSKSGKYSQLLLVVKAVLKAMWNATVREVWTVLMLSVKKSKARQVQPAILNVDV